MGSWYGGAAPDHYAYSMPLEQIGTDVILNAVTVLPRGEDLQNILNYQFGLLVTQDGVRLRRPDNAWLAEGMARDTSARTRSPRGAP